LNQIELVLTLRHSEMLRHRNGLGIKLCDLVASLFIRKTVLDV